MKQKNTKLGIFTLTALVTGNMIGSGVFMLPADLARVGSISLFSWVFTAFGSILLALVFSKLSHLIPRNGGPYAYAQHSFGNFIGFQLASCYWLAVVLSNGAVAIAFVGYLRIFFPTLTGTLSSTITALALIWLLTLVNIRGIHTAGRVQLVTMILKCGALLFVAILGWWFFHPEYIKESFNVSHQSNFSAFSYASTLTLWAFIGMESATIPASEVKNPSRSIPIATMIGVGIAAVIYIASSAVIMGMVPSDLLANSTFPFAAAAEIIAGKWGQLIIAAGALISCLGTLNGWILVQGQIPMAIADDKLFPKVFAKRNKNNVPARGIIISSIIMSLFLLLTIKPNLVDQFQFIILITTTAFLITYLYSSISMIMVIKGKRKFKNLLYLIISILAAGYSFWAIFGSGKEIVFYMLMFLFLTIPLYAIKQKRNKSLNSV